MRKGKSSELVMFFFNRERGLFLSVYVDDVILAGKKQNINPTWKIPMKDVDLGEPTSFLDHVYLGCTERECQISRDVVIITAVCSNQGFLLGATDKLPETKATGKPDAETISSWSYDMEGHAKKCVERYCEIANKTTEQFFKVATPCRSSILKRREWISWRIIYGLLTNCSEMFTLGTYW